MHVNGYLLKQARVQAQNRRVRHSSLVMHVNGCLLTQAKLQTDGRLTCDVRCGVEAVRRQVDAVKVGSIDQLSEGGVGALLPVGLEAGVQLGTGVCCG